MTGRMLNYMDTEIHLNQGVSFLLSIISQMIKRQMGPASIQLRQYTPTERFVREHCITSLHLPRMFGNSSIACELYSILKRYEQVAPLLLATAPGCRYKEVNHHLAQDTIVSINAKDKDSLDRLRGRDYNVVVIDADEELLVMDKLIDISAPNISKHPFFCIVVLGNG
jgi:hypothetical protein